MHSQLCDLQPVMILLLCFVQKREAMIAHSGKLRLLDKLLPRLKAGGHRCGPISISVASNFPSSQRADLLALHQDA